MRKERKERKEREKKRKEEQFYGSFLSEKQPSYLSNDLSYSSNDSSEATLSDYESLDKNVDPSSDENHSDSSDTTFDLFSEKTSLSDEDKTFGKPEVTWDNLMNPTRKRKRNTKQTAKKTGIPCGRKKRRESTLQSN